MAARRWRALVATGVLLSGEAIARLAGGAGTVPEIDIARVVIAFVICIAIGLGVIWWLRRYGGARLVGSVATGGAAQRNVRIVESARLHLRASLFVVEFDGRRILLAADANGVVRLAESRPPPAPAP